MKYIDNKAEDVKIAYIGEKFAVCNAFYLYGGELRQRSVLGLREAFLRLCEYRDAEYKKYR
jgi:hypothetical protein